MAGSRMVPEARRLALANNRARLAQLYAEHRRYTVNYIARRLKPQHSHVVDDLAQDTFVEAWPALHTVQVRDGSSYRRWLTAVARTRVWKYYYRPDRPNAAGCHGAEAPVSPHSPLWWSSHLVDDSTAAATEAVETRLDVHAALAQLPPVTRRILEQHYLQGLSRPAVARGLRMDNNKVQARITEGLAALRETLDDGTHGPPAPPASDRALAVAQEQITRHGGQWPTVREVARRAAVSQATAARALRTLRAAPAAETGDPIARARHAVAQAHQRVTAQATETQAQKAAHWHATDQATDHAANQGAAVLAEDGGT
jgi:RNA polymerase sigma factor (sigma-70 family)